MAENSYQATSDAAVLPLSSEIIAVKRLLDGSHLDIYSLNDADPLHMSKTRVDSAALERLHVTEGAIMLDEQKLMDRERALSCSVLSNPAAGAGEAVQVRDQLVVPLLEAAGYVCSFPPTSNAETTRRIAQSLARDQTDLVVVIGGDGFLHDFVNGLESSTEALPTLNVAQVPCGTANALFAHSFPPEEIKATPARTKLLSVQSALRTSNTPQPLPLMHTRLPATEVRTTVVTSFALHAAILHNAEKLRAIIPGMDRFKAAAQQSATTWWRGRIELDPDTTLAYSLAEDRFVPLSSPQACRLEGSFSYFACAVTSRFEPAFVIAPLRKRINEPAASTFDVVIVRPRGGTDTLDSPPATQEEREAFIPKLWETLTLAYQDGAHVKLRRENGSPVVEYYRTSSLVWTPIIDEAEETSGLVCCDGDLHRLKQGECVTVTAETSKRVKLWS